VPLLNIIPNGPASRHGTSTSRKLGIAFGCIIGIGFLTGLLILLYLILSHRLRARTRSRTWKRHLNLRKLYLDRGSHHDLKVSITGPVTMVVGGSEGSLSGGGDDTPTDPFAAIALDFSTPHREVSKSPSRSMRVRRESGWRNLEDYDYI